MPGEQHQRPQAQAQPDRGRRNLHQADADPGRLGRDPGAGAAAGPGQRAVRRFGGDKNPGAQKKAITAIAHTLLKIAYQVLNSGMPYQEPGADFGTRRESPEQKQAWLERQLQKLLHSAAPSPSPSARRRPHYQPALKPKLPDSDSLGRPADPGTPAIPRRTINAIPPPLATAQAKVRCRAPTGDPVVVSAH